MDDKNEGDFCTTTIYFDGQFYLALIEELKDGVFYVGRHIFGAEPGNAEVLDFMLKDFASVPRYPSQQHVRTKKRRSAKEQERITSKSKLIFSGAQKAFLEENKKLKLRKQKLQEKQKYELSQLKKKKKKNGH